MMKIGNINKWEEGTQYHLKKDNPQSKPDIRRSETQSRAIGYINDKLTKKCHAALEAMDVTMMQKWVGKKT